MNKYYCLLFLLFVFGNAFQAVAQEDNNQSTVDSLYREDQIYVGFTYNLLMGSPEGITGKQFSGGFHSGFIRDFPLNERRNIALGVGFGWSINTYGQNLFLGEDEQGNTNFINLEAQQVDFDTNRFSTHAIDLPVQFRWRTSTPESYKFWRIYAGLRPSYVYYFRSKFVQPGLTVKQTDIPEFDRFRLGATFTFGYNTFNFNFYYSLNSFFNKDARVDGEQIDLKTFQVGLMFFLL